MNDIIQFVDDDDNEKRMSSLEIAKITGKRHKDVLEAIRKMEKSWEKVSGRKFPLSSYKDSTGRNLPCYYLDKTECLYVATKFNDEARAKLVLRWKELEIEKQQHKQLSPVEMFALQAQINLQNEQRLTNIEQNLQELINEKMENEKMLLSAEISTEQLPEESESAKIRRLIHLYVKTTGMKYEDVWNSVYEKLEYTYGNRIRAYKKLSSDKSLLDVAIRNNLGQKIYNVISDMVKNVTNTKN